MASALRNFSSRNSGQIIRRHQKSSPNRIPVEKTVNLAYSTLPNKRGVQVFNSVGWKKNHEN